MTEAASPPKHFIQQRIEQDLATAKHSAPITRFPPEPNGYLHVGHAKSICLNFSMASQYAGQCHLRFDDTNPEKESQEYIDAIQRDVSWLGFQWAGQVRYASDYFQALYEAALALIKLGKAYVDSLDAEQIRAYRGSLTEPGKPSPYRERSVDENLALFEQMRLGEIAEGEAVLRAKIDMASGNINMRDPVIYRVRHAHHHQTGDTWRIYPMYDFTHCLSDSIEGITHSLCTLEFEDHRPLYDWVLATLGRECHPQQIEFARLNLSYTLTSKRKLKRLVDEQQVDGWDDPRMPTIAGMRRAGYPASALRQFCDMIGVTKSDSVVDIGMLEYAVRETLDKTAPRAMGVLHPLKVVLTNYPDSYVESLQVKNHPKDDSFGQRTLPFSRELYIEQDDFSENPPRKYKRLVEGGEVRLRGAYVIRCDQVIKDEQGQIVELRCSYDENTLGKNPEGRKVKGVIHWVSAAHAVDAEVRLYDRLFVSAAPDQGDEDFMTQLNPESLTVLTGCKLEASLALAEPEQGYQFERQGYFCLDSRAHNVGQRVFNRTISLRDTWAKEQGKG